jgi:hypothetical protein
MRDESCLQLSKQVEEVFRLIQCLKFIVNLFHNLGDPFLCSWVAVRRVKKAARGLFLPSAFPIDDAILARFPLLKA